MSLRIVLFLSVLMCSYLFLKIDAQYSRPGGGSPGEFISIASKAFMNFLSLMINQVVNFVDELNAYFTGFWERFLRVMDLFVNFVREDDCTYYCFEGREPIRNHSYVPRRLQCVSFGIEVFWTNFLFVKSS